MTQYRQYLELHWQAGQDAIENGHGWDECQTGASGGPLYVILDNAVLFNLDKDAAAHLDDLDAPRISRDRRFIIRVPGNGHDAQTGIQSGH